MAKKTKRKTTTSTPLISAADIWHTPKTKLTKLAAEIEIEAAKVEADIREMIAEMYS